LDDDTVEKYRRAGRIARDVLNHAREITREGARAIDIVNDLEGMIIERGAKCAFPVNICINDIAAHYTPMTDDSLSLSRGDLVKVDVGVHMDGCIADTATTVEISTSNWSDLVKASEEALACSTEMIKPGIPVSSIGTAIETAISSRGFVPIRNLTGHAMDRNRLHAGLAIPNISTEDKSVLKPGTVIAIEPFATNGDGRVDGEEGGNIYQIIDNRELSDEKANRFLQRILEEFDNLPLASRWCRSISDDYMSLIKKHRRHRNIRAYPILAEVAGGMVSQSEHSSLILDDTVIIYTK